MFLFVLSSVYKPAPGYFVLLPAPRNGVAEELSAPGKMYGAPMDTGSLLNFM